MIINLKLGKFIVRATLTILLMGIGTTIFFASDDNTLKIVGSNMVTAGWASWMSVGSSKIKPSHKTDDKEVDV